MAGATADDLSLLERRRIEAGVLVPLIRAFQKEFGEARVNELVGATIRDIARTQGEAIRERAKIENIEDFKGRMGAGPIAEGSLLVDVVEDSSRAYGFNVMNCKFVEMYREMGAGDLGFLLSCNRDAASFAGMAPGLEFERTQTRMQGAAFCDFRYRVREQVTD